MLLLVTVLFKFLHSNSEKLKLIQKLLLTIWVRLIYFHRELYAHVIRIMQDSLSSGFEAHLKGANRGNYKRGSV